MEPKFIWYWNEETQTKMFYSISQITWWSCEGKDDGPLVVKIRVSTGHSDDIKGEDAIRIQRQLEAFTYDPPNATDSDS